MGDIRKRDYFMFNKSILDLIQNLDAEMFKKLTIAIVEYWTEWKDCCFDGAYQVLFNVLKDKVDADNKNRLNRSNAWSKHKGNQHTSLSVEQTVSKQELVDNVKTNSVKDKTKEKKENNNLFEEFREKYPRKVNKKKAETSFKKLSEEDKRLAIDMIEKFKQTKQWQDKQYIPHPTTYLNWLRFKDEVDECDMAWYVDESKTEEIEKDEKIEEKFMKLWSEYPQNRRTNEFEARQIFYSMDEEEQDKSISMLKIYKMSENWSKNDWQYIIWICRYLKEKIYNVDPDEDKYHFSDPNSRWIRNKRWYIEEKDYLCH